MTSLVLEFATALVPPDPAVAKAGAVAAVSPGPSLRVALGRGYDVVGGSRVLRRRIAACERERLVADLMRRVAA